MRTGAVCWREISPSEVAMFALKGILPVHGLQPLLHEFAAHYWCANTPVSRAIQMRWLDYGRRTGMLLSTDAFAGDDFHEQVKHFDPNLVAVAAELAGVEACLRPFAEGIATFAEFDFYPPLKRGGTSVPYLTQITMLIAQRNANATGDRRPGVGSILRARESLQASRVAEATIHRKSDLLCHPAAHGGMEDCYLLGYTLVKSIHDKVRRLYGDQLDVEAVISFLIYHVYWDWRIVDLLVSNERLRPSDVMSLVRATIEELFDQDFLERYRAWDKWLHDLDAAGESESGRRNEMPFHGLTTEEIQAIKKRGENFIENRLLPNGPRGMDLVLSIPRHMLNLCALYTTNVWVEIDSSNSARLFVDNERGRQLVAMMDIVERLPAQQTAGSLTVYGTFQPAGLFTMLVSLRAGKSQITLGSIGPGGEKADWLKTTNFWLKGEAAHHDTLESFCETIETIIQGVDRESGRNMFANTLEAAEQGALDTYRELVACQDGPGQSLVSFAGGLSAEDDSGVRSLFNDGRMFDAYSLLGLCNSFTADRAELAKLLAAQDYDLDQLLRYTERIDREHQVRLIAQTTNNELLTAF